MIRIWPCRRKVLVRGFRPPRPAWGSEFHRREFGRRRKIHQFLELGHEMDLTAAIQRIYAFFGGDHGIAVKVRGALLKFGEIFDAL